MKVLLIIVLLMTFPAEIQADDAFYNHLEDKAYAIASARAQATGAEVTSRGEIKEIIKWIDFYANNRTEFMEADFDPYDVDYEPRQLLKDAMAIIWEESWFINETSQDDGTGFGWAALQWGTAKDLQSRVYKWEKFEKNSLYKHKEQAKYMVGYILWLKNHYSDRHRTILGYNKGPGVVLINGQQYFLKFIQKRREIDAHLMEAL